MKIIKKNILTVTNGVIVHQVNCKGKMGTGLALQIRRKWPHVYNEYKKKIWRPGLIQLVQVDLGLYVCNLAGQNGYGRDKCYTEYIAVEEGFFNLACESVFKNIKNIFIPENMGCNNAGGDWNIYKGIIEDIIPDAVICRWP